MDKPHRNRVSLGMQSALLIVCILLVYWPTFTGGFLLDDHVLVENNAFIRRIKPLHQYFFQEDGVDRSQWSGDYHTGYYRPLVSLTYALDYRFWGNSPTGYRATNLMFHLAVCLILLALIHGQVAAGWSGLAAVLLFALHPVNTEAVAWISSRNNLMAAFFSLAALYGYAFGDRSSIYGIGGVLCFALALFSKEFGVMVLPMLFVWNRTLGAGRRSRRTEALAYLPYLAVLGVYFVLRTAVTGAVLSPHGGADALTRLVWAPYLILYNLRLVFLPVGLHSFSVSYPLGDGSALAAAGLIGLSLIGWLLWRFRRNQAAVMGALAFGLGLCPVLNIVPTSAVSLISMRWLYFPLAFFAIAFPGPIDVLARKRSGLWLTGAVVAALAAATWFSVRYHWQDESAFYRREVVVFGNGDYAGGLADRLHGQGDFAAAERYYLQGLAARPDLVENTINYAALLIDTGRPERALAALDRIAGQAMSRENTGRLANNRAMAMARLGRRAQAITLFEKAVHLAPGEPIFWANLASTHAMEGHLAQAAGILENGLARRPSSIDLRAMLVRIHLDRGDAEAAARVFAELPASERRKRADLALRIQRAGAAPASKAKP